MKKRFLTLAGITLFAGLSLATLSNIKPQTVSETKADFTPVSVSEYYKSINSSMKGDTLKVALYNIIKGHDNFGYGTAELAMRQTDRNWDLSPDPNDQNPYMVLFYADYNESNPQLWNTSQGSYGSTTNYVWNKEHIWAKDNGIGQSKSGTAYGDLHHLRASDWKLNNERSNYALTVVTGGSQSPNAFGNSNTGCYVNKSANLFEPSDRYKGDCARALFYMATRYYSADGCPTALNLSTATTSGNGTWGYLDTLLAWHELDPVDNFEIRRNQIIYEDYQHNRNPYIDHPEYARAVFKNETIVEPKKLTNLTLNGTPTKTSYKEGASFNPNGLTVTAYYDDNSNADVTSSVTWEKVTSSSVTGTYTYGGDSLQVTVNGLTVEHINGLTYTGTPTKTTYNAGDNFDPTGLTVRATYSGGSSEVVTSEVTWSPSPLTYGTGAVVGTLGDYSIKVQSIKVNNIVSQNYTIKFKDASSDASAETSNNNIKDLIESGKDNVSTISNSSKVYAGKTGLKLGSGSAIGKFTINLAADAKVAAQKIKVGIKKYGTDTGTVGIETDKDSKQSVSPEADLNEKEVTLSGQVISTITISTSTKRAYLSYITVVSSGNNETDPIQVWIDGYMHMNDSAYSGQGTGLCISQNTYIHAKNALMLLESAFIKSFEDNEGNKYTNALNRYLAWANAAGDNAPFVDNGFNGSMFIENVYNFNETYIIVIVVASIILMSGTTLLLLRKKRK